MPVRLPRDDGPRPSTPLQWWYWSGLLSAKDGRGAAGGAPSPGPFGFQLVFFAVDPMGSSEASRSAAERDEQFTPMGRFCFQLAESAFADLGAQRFVREERIWHAQPRMLDGAFDLASPDGIMRAKGGGGIDRLSSRIHGYRLELSLHADRPALVHFGGEEHRFEFGGGTYYYSRPSMTAEGVITTPSGESLEVSGDVWFDRQWGDLKASVLNGWQWFAIHLDDGRDIVLYDFNRYPSERMGAISSVRGKRVLAATDMSIITTATWTSPHTRDRYPAAWQIAIAGGPDLSIEPLLADQELGNDTNLERTLLATTGNLWLGPEYWEGACRVTGAAGERGHAYVELVGFGPKG